jgi:diguanylate cyclase (GGDEF)-like protein
MELSLRLASVALVSFMAIVLAAGAVRRRIMLRRLGQVAQRPGSIPVVRDLLDSELLVPAGGSCHFDWNLVSGELEFEPRRDAAAGPSAGAGRATPEPMRWSRFCHPDDLSSLEMALREHVGGRAARMVCEIRIRKPGHPWRWVLLQAELSDRPGGASSDHVRGVLVDVDELKRSQQILAGQSRVAACGGIVAFSFAARAPNELALATGGVIAGRSAEAFAGQAIKPALADLIHAEDLASARACVDEALRQPGTAAEVELRSAGANGEGSWARFHTLALGSDEDALIHACLVPIEEQKRAEALASERLAQLQRVVLKTGETQRFLEGLQHTTELLQLAENESDGDEVVSQAGEHLFPGWLGAVTVADIDGSMTVVSRWGGGSEIDALLARGAESDCWAVRRGRLHHVSSAPAARGAMPACGHFGCGDALPVGIAHTVCVPFSRPAGRPGALHLLVGEKVDQDELYATFWRAETLVETLELSLANLHLRVTLREQADRDGMTGLFNRRYFDDALQREISRARRSGDELVLALLDIDRFKLFNDAFGHEAGDEVIKSVADQLSSFVRSYDVACRIGGEELALLMSSASLRDACARLDRLREQIPSRTLRHKDMELPPVTISVGVASLQDDSPAELLRRADLALYASKYGGRNRLTCWTPDLEMDSPFPESEPAELAASSSKRPVD